MYGKGRRNILLLFVNLPRQLVYSSIFLVNSSTCLLVYSSTRQPYPIQLELCKKIYKVLQVVIKLLTLCIYLQTN